MDDGTLNSALDADADATDDSFLACAEALLLDTTSDLGVDVNDIPFSDGAHEVLLSDGADDAIDAGEMFPAVLVKLPLPVESADEGSAPPLAADDERTSSLVVGESGLAAEGGSAPPLAAEGGSAPPLAAEGGSAAQLADEIEDVKRSMHAALHVTRHGNDADVEVDVDAGGDAGGDVEHQATFANRLLTARYDAQHRFCKYDCTADGTVRCS
jgi:hypothetical protein